MNDNKEIGTWYDEIAKEYNANWFRGYRNRYLEETVDRYIFSMVDFSGKKVLDIGCGTGRITKRLAQLSESVVGIDVSAGMLVEAEKRLEGLTNVKLLHTDGSATDFEAGEYDVVICVGSLEFVPDENKLFDEIYRILNPKGLFIFTIRKKLPISQLRFLNPVGKKRNLHFKKKEYRDSEIRQLLTESRFTLIRRMSTLYFPTFLLGSIHDKIRSKFINETLFKVVVKLTDLFNVIPLVNRLGPSQVVLASKASEPAD